MSKLLFVAVALSLGPGVAQAQGRAEAAQAQAKTRAEAKAAVDVAPDSPRISLQRYLELARQARFNEAARYLAIPPHDLGRAADLARHLKAVLDRHIWFDLEQISPLSTGDTHDGLPAAQEQIGSIPRKGGATNPVILVRHKVGNDALWQFSSATVAQIDSWYDELGNQWLFDHLPPLLLKPGPKELLWWQWLALPLIFALAWLLGWGLSFITRAVAGRIAKRTATQWDDVLLQRIAGPLALGWAIGATYMLLPVLDLYAPALAFLHRGLGSVFFIAFFWWLLRLTDTVGRAIILSGWAKQHPASRSLVPLGSRVAKVVVLAVAIVAVLSELGYPVASLIAGLGIGGLAVALAAQKTVENLFGAFSIGVDQPFREGDFVRIEDFVGTVETIGLRSTKIRTLDRTLVSLPNGRLSDMRLESFAARDRIRLALTVGLVYETTAAQMRTILAELERVLRAHPKIWPEAVIVRFANFGASSLDVDIMAWFETSDWGEFQLIRQDVLLQFMEVVEAAGSSFAFPTRTVHLVPDKPVPVEHHRTTDELRAEPRAALLGQ